MKGIAGKILLIFLIPIALIITTGFAAYKTAANGITQNFEQSALTTLGMLGNYFSYSFQTQETKSMEYVMNAEFKKYFSGRYDAAQELEQIKKMASAVGMAVKADESLQGFYFLADEKKSLVNSQIYTENLYEKASEDEKVQAFLSAGSSSGWIGSHMLLDEKISLQEEAYAITHIRYLLDENGKKIGLIMMDISMDFIKEGLMENNLPEGSIAAFITPDGREIVYGKEDFSFQDNGFGPGEECRHVKWQGAEYLLLYEQVEVSGAHVGALVPLSSIVSQIQAVKQLSFIMAALASVAAILCVMWLARYIAGTIKRANQALQTASMGNLTVRMQHGKKDEFFVLAQAINGMTERMCGLLREIRLVGEHVNVSALKLHTCTENMDDSVQDMHLAIQNIEKGAELQAEEIGQCNGQMSELAEQIEEVSGHAKVMGQTAKDAGVVLEEGIQTVNELSKKLEATGAVTREMIQDVEQLNEASGEISRIITVMDSIAEQTNLLSLNASIEAARAGEAGKGFAVVADEIRRLTEQSRKAAHDIGDILSNIRSLLKITQENSKKTQQQMDEQELAIQNTIVAFETIGERVGGLTGLLARTAQGISTMDERKNGTLLLITDIAAASQETSAAATTLLQGAEEQLKVLQDLKLVKDVVEKEIEELYGRLALFQVDLQTEQPTEAAEENEAEESKTEESETEKSDTEESAVEKSEEE